MKNMQKFKIGDKVKWSSQAQGSTTYKEGAICFVVPPGMTQRSAMAAHEKIVGVGVVNFLPLGGGTYRDHESYFVEVVTSKKAMPKIYQPKVKDLILC